MLKTIIKLLHSGTRPLAAVCIGLLVASCASKTSVSSDWLDKSAKRSQFASALIVGVSATADRRRSFEDAVAEGLRRPGTEVWTSSRLMAPETEINKETVLTVAQQQKADAVIVTRVTKLEIEPVEVGGRSAILAQEQQSGESHIYRRQAGTLFRYDYDEDIESTYVTTEYTTKLTTEVYDAESGELIYTVVASAKKMETIAEVIDVLSKKIAEQLRKDRVIK